MFKFELGQVVKDKVTGVVGAIMSRTEFFTGCLQYGLLNQKLKKDGSPHDWIWIDEVRLIATGKKVSIAKIDKGPGGPEPCAPETN